MTEIKNYKNLMVNKNTLISVLITIVILLSAWNFKAVANIPTEYVSKPHLSEIVSDLREDLGSIRVELRDINNYLRNGNTKNASDIANAEEEAEEAHDKQE